MDRQLFQLGTRTLSATDVFETQDAAGNLESGKNTLSNLKIVLSLDNVNNTSDVSKPVSTAQASAIASAAAAKQDVLISGTNIKTVNGNAVTGSGNINILPYKIYAVEFSQIGTGAPTVSIILNQLSGAIVWTRNSVGSYTGTLSGAFPANKSYAIYSSLDTVDYDKRFYQFNDNQFFIEQRNAGTPIDGVSIYLEIKVYY